MLPVDSVLPALRDCLTWCAALREAHPGTASLADVFRSPELQEAAQSVLDESLSVETERVERVQRFAAFLTLRHRLAAERSAAPPPSDADIHAELTRPQALLIADWRSSDWNQLSPAECGWFLDDLDIPPWDTWLALAELSYKQGAQPDLVLLSWVPPWLASAMDEAISASAVSCLNWAEVRGQRLEYRNWARRWNECTDDRASP